MRILKTIGIGKLKSNLSSYIREVKAGTTILITDHGDIVAELRAPEKEYAQLKRDRLRQEWIDAGKLLLPQEDKKPLKRSPISFPAGTSIRILDDERKESI